MPKESRHIQIFVKQGEARGNLRAARSHLLKFVELMESPIPEPIRATIEETTDLNALDLWFAVAASSRSLADLRNAMRAGPW